jgi:hypothetical protein
LVVGSLTESKSAERTLKLRLDRIADVIVDVPADAEFIVDTEYTFNTRTLYEEVHGRYKKFNLRILKVWAKQADGTFKLEWWPCDPHKLHAESHSETEAAFRTWGLKVLKARHELFILYQDHLRKHLGQGDQRTIRNILKGLENPKSTKQASRRPKDG